MEPTAKPVPKVQAGINYGAGATIFVTVVAVFYPEAYGRIPPGFEMALGTFVGSLAATGAAYLTNDNRH